MNTLVNEPIEVLAVFKGSKLEPKKVKWRNRVHEIIEIGYVHKEKRGRSLVYVFNITTASLFMKAAFDTELLNWKLEEVADEN